jgi:hypothetical protein
LVTMRTSTTQAAELLLYTPTLLKSTNYR